MQQPPTLDLTAPGDTSHRCGYCPKLITWRPTRFGELCFDAQPVHIRHEDHGWMPGNGDTREFAPGYTLPGHHRRRWTYVLRLHNCPGQAKPTAEVRAMQAHLHANNIAKGAA